MTMDIKKTLFDADTAAKMARENEYKEIAVVFKYIEDKAAEGHYQVTIPGKLNDSTLAALQDCLFDVRVMGEGFGAITRINFERRPAIGQIRKRIPPWQDIAAMQFLALVGWTLAIILAGLFLIKRQENKYLIKEREELHGIK